MKIQNEDIQGYLDNLGIAQLNALQVECLSVIPKSDNTIIYSPTGSGKTLGFLLPTITELIREVDDIQILIVSPTRELSLQTHEVIKKLKTGYKATCCYGGHPMDIEKNQLIDIPSMLIGTPGRLCDHLRRQHLDLTEVKFLIFDEFDKILELGFLEEIEFLYDDVRNADKVILCSATQMNHLPQFINRRKFQTIDYTADAENRDTQISSFLVASPEKDKLPTLEKLLYNLPQGKTLVFCNYRESVERVYEYLMSQDITADYFHGGLNQLDRETTLITFINGSQDVLITTDLAARGLDIQDINYIIHYHLPHHYAEYVHRNGRTARVDRTGQVYVINYVEQDLPEYLNDINLNPFELADDIKHNDKPKWVNVELNKGKSAKLSKGDIAGALLKNTDLTKDDLGLISIKHYFSYVAIKRETITKLDKHDQLKIKGKTVKINVEL